MILTGRRFSAEEALRMGLVNRVYPKKGLQQGINELAEELLGKSGAVLRIALKGLRELCRSGSHAGAIADGSARRHDAQPCGDSERVPFGFKKLPF